MVIALCREIKNRENFIRTDFRKIRENMDPRKFPAIRYVMSGLGLKLVEGWGNDQFKGGTTFAPLLMVSSLWYEIFCGLQNLPN